MNPVDKILSIGKCEECGETASLRYGLCSGCRNN